ncbi:unnamed protein product [Nyctereutes procyonoides]|uniref:Cytochrome c oxidase subunit 7B, mitochondrial n=1 Tax=Nyctereutes procyonoides TaxID=34880 RepID=A0A811YJL9_NYCPR|nr:unnamed protein product [Nyctereutes procyonoides]
MFPMARNALSHLRVQSIPQTMARQSPETVGTTFCIAVWAYTATQIGVEWNLSPVGRVTPKEWRDQ